MRLGPLPAWARIPPRGPRLPDRARRPACRPATGHNHRTDGQVVDGDVRNPACTVCDRLVGGRGLARLLPLLLPLLTALLLALPWAVRADEPLRIGSKRFTEAYVLAEVLAAQAAPHARTEVLAGLGNTAIVWEALRSGRIDLYPEYLGTIDLEILKNPAPTSLAEMRRRLEPLGFGIAIPFGFNNGYALAMRDAEAERLGIRRLGDLAAHPGLEYGLSNEFIGRADGWPGLARRYGLNARPTGIDHGIAYDALARGQIDLTDIYTTDAKIESERLRVLEDDLGYFPRYDAVVLYRLDVPQRFPAAWQSLQRLEGAIDERQMIAMNARAELHGVPFATIARDWLAGARSRLGASSAAASAAASATASASASAPATGAASSPAAGLSSPGAAAGSSPSAAAAGSPPSGAGSTASARNDQAASDMASAGARDPGARGFTAKLFGPDLARLARQHLMLVAASVALAVLIGVPSAIAVAHRPRPRALLLGLAGVLQTIPSIALLAALISWLGVIGTLPALIALTLYALLPIMRNTATGLAGVPRGLRTAAVALGLQPRDQLLSIELPLAFPTLIAGVRTATVIGVGTATLAAFIGAGGFGERIVTGLALNDRELMLAGALPAAVLAIACELLFELLERAVRRPA